MILDGYLNALRNADFGDGFTPSSHIIIGTGTTAPAASDTTLQTEVFPDGANRSTISSSTKPASRKVRHQILLTIGQANGSDISEVGEVNAASGGTLANRIVLATPVAKDPTFELKIQVQKTYTREV